VQAAKAIAPFREVTMAEIGPAIDDDPRRLAGGMRIDDTNGLHPFIIRRAAPGIDKAWQDRDPEETP
jgi:hypothetical protein